MMVTLDSVIAASQQAVGLDKSGRFEDALKSYRKCIHLLNSILSNPTDETLNKNHKFILETRLAEFELRIEQLQSLSRPLSRTSCSTSSSSDNLTVTLTPKPTTQDQFKAALASVVSVSKPTISFRDVAGLTHAKEAIEEAVIFPRNFPHLFHGSRKPWKAILLYGPPGTGKTLLAKATANAVNATLLAASSADLLSKWQGESEKLVRALFELARDLVPSVVFIDEVDSLCCARTESDTESTRRIKTEILVQLTRLHEEMPDVLVLGATNVPWDLDVAVLRRFERRICVDLPDWAARRQIFELHLEGEDHRLTDTDFDELAEVTNGYSAHDIAMVIQDALFEPMRELKKATHVVPIGIKAGRQFYQAAPNTHPRAVPIELIPKRQVVLPPMTREDFDRVAAHTKRTVHQDQLKKFAEWSVKFGS